MQVVPHLFKIIFVLFTVFLWGLISDFTCLVILICIYKNYQLYFSTLQLSVWKLCFWKMWWQKAMTAQDFSHLALPTGFVCVLEGLPFIQETDVVWYSLRACWILPCLLRLWIMLANNAIFFMVLLELHVPTRKRKHWNAVGCQKSQLCACSCMWS